MSQSPSRSGTADDGQDVSSSGLQVEPLAVPAASEEQQQKQELQPKQQQEQQQDPEQEQLPQQQQPTSTPEALGPLQASTGAPDASASVPTSEHEGAEVSIDTPVDSTSVPTLEQEGAEVAEAPVPSPLLVEADAAPADAVVETLDAATEVANRHGAGAESARAPLLTSPSDLPVPQAPVPRILAPGGAEATLSASCDLPVPQSPFAQSFGPEGAVVPPLALSEQPVTGVPVSVPDAPTSAPSVPLEDNEVSKTSAPNVNTQLETPDQALQELVLRVPVELQIPATSTLQEIRDVMERRLAEAELEPLRSIGEMVLGISGAVCEDPEAQPLRTLVPGSLVSLVHDVFEAVEVAAMGLCLSVPQVQAMQFQSQLFRNASMGGPPMPGQPMLPGQHMPPQQMPQMPPQAAMWRPVQVAPRPRIDEAMRERFYKTRLCVNFVQNTCTYGVRCHFAHGEHELRRRLGNLVPVPMGCGAPCAASAGGMGLEAPQLMDGADQRGGNKWSGGWGKWDGGKDWKDWNEWKSDASWWGDWGTGGGAAWGRQGGCTGGSMELQGSKDWSSSNSARDLDGELESYWGGGQTAGFGREGDVAVLKLAPASDGGTSSARRPGDERAGLDESARRAVAGHKSPGAGRLELRNGASTRRSPSKQRDRSRAPGSVGGRERSRAPAVPPAPDPRGSGGGSGGAGVGGGGDARSTGGGGGRSGSAGAEKSRRARSGGRDRGRRSSSAAKHRRRSHGRSEARGRHRSRGSPRGGHGSRNSRARKRRCR